MRSLTRRTFLLTVLALVASALLAPRAWAIPTYTVYTGNATDNRIDVFDGDDGTPLTSFGAGFVAGPSGVRKGPDGNVYVANKAANSIGVFTTEGAPVRTILPGGPFVGASDLDFAPDGSLFVVYSNSNHVVGYGPADLVITAWSTGAGSSPQRITVAPGPTGSQLFVSTWGSGGDPAQPPGLNDRVLVYNPFGALLQVIGTGGVLPGQMNNPSGVAVNPVNGFFYVLDSGNNGVERRAPTGAFLNQWGSGGTGDGQFASATGIELVGGRIWIADFLNNRVQSFDLDGNFVSKLAANSPTDVAVEFAAPTAPTITTTPATDATVGQQYTYAAAATGSQPMTWTLLSSPPGMTVDPATGLVQWTPTAAGDFGVTLGVSNAAGSVTQTWTVHVGTVTDEASVTIQKDTVPDGPRAFAFQHDFSGSPQAFTLADDGPGGGPSSRTFPVTPGTYTVVEAAAEGFVLTGITCGDAVFLANLEEGSAEIEVSAGEAITCTFVNEADEDNDGVPNARDLCPGTPPGVKVDPATGCPLGRITVEKTTVPQDAQDFRFLLSRAAGARTAAMLDDDGDESDDPGSGKLPRRHTFDDLEAASALDPWILAEVTTPGWTVTGVMCRTEGGDAQGTQPGPAVTVPLAPGEHVICTFTNERDDDNDGVPNRLDRCPGSPVGVPVDPANGCADSQLGRITIVKDALPDDLQNFEFDGTLSEFVLEDAPAVDDDVENPDPLSNRVFQRLFPGTYSFAEKVPEGWDLTKIECFTDEGAPIGDVFLGDGLVTLELAQGQGVVCTFSNRKRGTITIIKNTVPDDPEDFGFLGPPGFFTLDDDGDPTDDPFTGKQPRSMTFANLAPGIVPVIEFPDPPWNLVLIFCEDTNTMVDLGARTAYINLDPGENVTCTFTNIAPDEPVATREHYLGYEVHRERPIFAGEDVLLTDQFVEERVHVGAARMLLNPVEKRRQGRAVEPIQRPDDHLKCYRVTGGLRQDRDVRVFNQFTPSGATLHVKEPNRLCAPATKSLDGPPLAAPADGQHYKCYRVEEDSPFPEERVELEDQFGVLRAVVRRAEALCNPVTKQRDGRGPEPPPRPEDHLVCYGIAEEVPFAPRIVFTRDQFITQRVRVFDPLVLCVPSMKVDTASP